MKRRCGIRVLVAAALLAATAEHARGQVCDGDCDGDGMVTAAEIAWTVDVALLREPTSPCPSALGATIEILVRSVRHHLLDCPGAPTRTPTPTATPTSTPAATPTQSGSQDPPTTAAALLAWLQAGSYLDWHAESAAHDSVAPHFGRVRTFLNDAVFDSLSAGNAEHPRGSALVKELYGSAGTEVRGWAVMVKTQETSGVGAGWYWYERFGTSTFANGNSSPLCYNCHGNDFDGLSTRDFVLSSFPLQ